MTSCLGPWRSSYVSLGTDSRSLYLSCSRPLSLHSALLPFIPRPRASARPSLVRTHLYESSLPSSLPPSPSLYLSRRSCILPTTTYLSPSAHTTERHYSRARSLVARMHLVNAHALAEKHGSRPCTRVFSSNTHAGNQSSFLGCVPRRCVRAEPKLSSGRARVLAVFSRTTPQCAPS